MKLNKQIQLFLKFFFNPRVVIFILIGTAIIFLTFLTDNNALEIAISAMASVFIGVGVNNLSSLETHLKDQQETRFKIEDSLKMLQIVKSQVARIRNDVKAGNYQNITGELEELEQLMNLSIKVIMDD